MTTIFEYVIAKIISSFNVMLNLKFDIYGFEVSLFSLELALLVCFVLIRFMLFGLTRESGSVGGFIRHHNVENAKEKRKQKNDK